MIRILAGFLVFSSTAVLAQPTACPNGPAICERLLLPIFSPPIDGAFGSRFVTSMSVFNRGSSPTTIWGPVPSCVHFILCNSIETSLPARGYSNAFDRNGNPGLLVYVPADDASTLSVLLRVQDISRQAQTWGTAIPVVRDADYFSGLIALLDVPSDDRFRLTLRVYGATPAAASARVRIIDQSTNAAIREFVLDLAAGSDLFHPAYASFTAFPTPPRATWLYRIEIDPATESLRLWAFVSVTNNETQHITLITPR